jgi:hypothetical protein
VFSGVSVALIATQRCGINISAAVNQRATIEEDVFSVEIAPRLYNEDLRQLELRIEMSFGIPSRVLGKKARRTGTCSRELRESLELAVGRIMARKEKVCAEKTS